MASVDLLLHMPGQKTNAELVQVYCDWFSIPFAITYLYNMYGCNELSSGKYATLIAIYIEKIKSGEAKLPVVKPGTQSRHFTHIFDIVSGLIAVGAKGHGDEFGIGSDEAYSIIDVELCQFFLKSVAETACQRP